MALPSPVSPVAGAALAFSRRSASPDSELLRLRQSLLQTLRAYHAPTTQLVAFDCALASLGEEVGVASPGYLGLRFRELAGLKRPRLNLLRPSLEVTETLVEVRGRISFGEPKTAASRRTLALPAFLVSELQTHLDRFATHDEIVFAGRDGGPLRRTNFRSRVWLPAVESAELTPLRFHDLRHTAAGLMIAQGAHPKLIQSRLGHSSIQVTFDVYGHLLPALDEELAKGLDAARNAALSETAAWYLLHPRGELRESEER